MMRLRSSSLDSGFYAHYESGVEEKRLLKEGSYSLEFYRTKQILSRYLPRKPVTILDVGGGPGRYSFWLASKGHRVHLVDIVPLHIRQARAIQRKSKHPLASIRLGDARKLDLENGSVDIVVLFGPLYHLVQKKERFKALSEARRVLSRRGLVFAAGISRFTSALDGAFMGYIRDPAFIKIIEQDLKTGQHRNPDNVPEYFTTSFFHHPDELKAELRQAGFKSIKVYAITGFAWLMPKLKQFWADPTLRSQLLAILEQLELEPSMLGVSDHLLAIGQK